MKLTKTLQKKFSNVFVAILSEKNEYVLKYIVIKNEKIKESEEKRFPMDEDKKLSSDIKEFLLSLQKGYKFVYIAVLLESISQNCLSGCEKEKLKEYGVEEEKVYTVCVDKKWMSYVLKSDILWLKSIFEEVGLDFIYSPFLVLNNFIRNKKSRNKNTLHLLYSVNSITLMLFDEEKLVFNAFFKIPFKEFDFKDEDEEELKPEEDTSIDGIELDNIESEDEEFEGFVDITKLEDDDDSFKEDEEILQDAKEQIASSSLEDLELYGREVIIFKYIKSAIEEYYKNDKYDSEFLEDIIFYCDSNISNDIITMIENDLFLNVEIHSIDIKEEMINMSIKEVDF